MKTINWFNTPDYRRKHGNPLPDMMEEIVNDKSLGHICTSGCQKDFDCPLCEHGVHEEIGCEECDEIK